MEKRVTRPSGPTEEQDSVIVARHPGGYTGSRRGYTREERQHVSSSLPGVQTNWRLCPRWECGTRGLKAERSMLESFLAVLRGERPDRVVWTGDLAYWIAGRKQQSEARPEWDTEEGYLRLHAELGLMPYVYYEKFWAAEPRYDASVDIGVQVRGGTATRTFCTPVGELREENFYSPTSCSTAITRYAVQSKRDLEVLLYLVEHRHLEPMHMGDYRQRARLWRNYGGLPCIGLPRSPLSALCYEWAGVQNAVYLIADHEDLVLEVFERMEAQEDPILEAIGALAPPLVHFPDNLSSANLASLYANSLPPFTGGGSSVCTRRV